MDLNHLSVGCGYLLPTIKTLDLKRLQGIICNFHSFRWHAGQLRNLQTVAITIDTGGDAVVVGKVVVLRNQQ
jgi:hypothetical protein